MKIKREKIDQVFYLCLFLGYLVFNAILFQRHEPWRDEANVWLMGRELSPFQLFREIKYQGHPCLWYLFVMPFAKLGLPFRTIEIVSFLVMAFGAAIFVWKAPVHGITKTVCLFSPIFSYFYPTIARNYCLIALLLLLLAWQFPRRNEKCILYGLLLGLLVQSDTIAIAQAGMLSMMWLCENLWSCCRTKCWQKMKRITAGLLLPLVSLLLWVAQFYQVSDSPQFGARQLGVSEFLHETKNFAYGILSRMTGWESKYCLLFFISCFVLLAVLSLRLKNGWAMGVLLVSFLFQAAFSAVIYQLHIWHYISLCFVFLLTIWILFEQMKEKQIFDRFGGLALGGLQVLLALFGVCMFFHWNSEEETSNLQNALHGLYSDGGNTAAFIRSHLSPEELLVSGDIPMASTVVAYLPEYEFYFAGNGQRETYADWSEEQSQSITFEDLLSWVKEKFPEKEEFYLLWMEDAKIEDAEALEACEILYRTMDKTVRDEAYTLYRIRLP